MEKNKITYIERKPATSAKTGKTYERLILKTDRDGNTLMSGFGSATTRDWKMGDEVELKVERVAKDGKEYLNFEYAKAPALADKITALEADFKKFKETIRPMFLEWQKNHKEVNSDGSPIPNFDVIDKEFQMGSQAQKEYQKKITTPQTYNDNISHAEDEWANIPF